MELKYNYFLNLIWALAVFAAFIGYGRQLAKRCKWHTPATHAWAWHAVWGMASILAVGGFLMALSWAKAGLLILMVLAGTGLWIWQTTRDLIKGRLMVDTVDWLRDFPLWVLMGIFFLSAVAWPHQIDPNDDLLLYLTMPVRILQEGTLLEPFSFRRAGTYGGHSMLQALMMSLGCEKNGHVVDMGWSRVILFGLIASLMADLRRRHYLIYLPLLLLLFLIPVPRINTMSALSGGLFVFAALAHLTQTRPSTENSLLNWLPLALALMAAATMRPNFAAQAGGAALMTALLLLWLRKRDESRAIMLFLAKSLAASGVLLIPWMLVLYRSNGTISLPPFYGWTDPAFLDMSSRLGIWTDLKNGLIFLCRLEVIGFMAGLWVFLRGNSAGPVAWAASISTTVFGLYLAYKCSIVIPSETFRYLFPMLLAAFAFVVGTWLNDQAKSGQFNLTSPWTAAFCVSAALIAWTQLVQGLREFRYTLSSIPVQIEQDGPIVRGGKPFFQQLQSVVPEQAKILAVVDFPYLLDYRRNTIYNIDAIGGSSLPPGLPYFQGANAVRDYLLSQGIDTIMSVKFDKAVLMYTRRLWLNHNRPEWYFTEIWGKHALDLMDSIDELQSKGHTLIENEAYRVFTLEKH